MRRVFADAVYWVALAHRQDHWHARAVQTSRALGRAVIVTTEDVFLEVLAHFSGYGRLAREGAVRYVESILSDPDVVVHPQSHQSFLSGFALYKARPDKGYSLVDCISMQAMWQEGLSEVLTHDNHFAQEGFTLLL
jgi:predicted nucleic acid-binding protein